MSTRPIHVTQTELRTLLEQAIQRATAVTFTALTTPEQKLVPGLCGQRVKKLQRVNAMAGCRYQAAAERKGLTASDERAWGDRESSALVAKPRADGTVSYYLPVQLNHVSRPLYLVPGEAGKLRAIEPAKVQPYLRPERPNPVAAYKDYALSSLLSVHIGGRRYRVRQEA